MKNPTNPEIIRINRKNVSMFDDDGIGVSVLRDEDLNDKIKALAVAVDRKVVKIKAEMEKAGYTEL